MKLLIDLTGRKIGKLFVVREFLHPYVNQKERRKTIRKLECICDCGHHFDAFKSNVLAGKTKGCLRCARATNLVGRKVGKIEIIERFWNYSGRQSRVWYKIKCECGNIYDISSNTARHLKGFRCAKCPTKPPPLLSRQQALSLTNYKKHLKATEKKIGMSNEGIKLIKFDHWEQKTGRRIPFYLYKCKCGKKFVARGDILKTTKSCGCRFNQKNMSGEKNPFAKLKNEEARSIRELALTNIYTNREIAKMYKIDDGAVSKIILGHTYRIKKKLA